MDGVVAETLDDGLMGHALQAAAVNRELRHLVAGIEAALLMPDLLPMTGQVEQLVGADRDLVEPIEQTDAGKLADRMRQGIDADAELADGIRLFVDLAVDAAGPQHERGGQTTDTAADDDRLHGLNSNPDATDGLKSHSPLFGRKRLCGLGLELGAGFRLSLNFKVLEILPVAH